MTFLPNTVDVTNPQGSQWSTTYLLQNSDGTLMNIIGKTFEFAIRRAVTDTGSPTLSVTSGASTANGQIIVDTTASTVQVILTATGTALLTHGGGPYILWMDPGQTSATALVVGTFYAPQVAAP